MPDDKPFTRAKDLAYRYLAIRGRSRAELSGYLARKEVPEDIADRVLLRLDELGYIDDRRFAFDYARYLVGRRSLSRFALSAELRRKGVSDADILPALDELFGEDGMVEYEVALSAARRKADSLSGLPDRVKARRRLTDFLKRRGFSFDIIRRVTNDVM